MKLLTSGVMEGNRNVSHLRVFGCMNVPVEGERRKLDKKSKKMRFVGNSITSKGYRVLDETNRKLSSLKSPEGTSQ